MEMREQQGAMYVPAGWRATLSTLMSMVRKEFTILTRYPIEFVASFFQVFLIIAILTFAGLMFRAGGVQSETSDATNGIIVYGFVLFLFLSDTLWSIGFNVRREQKQGTLEQLYLSPASKFASLAARVIMSLVWTSFLAVLAITLMRLLLGYLPFNQPLLALYILLLSLGGTFGTGFAFAALTLRIKETAQVLINLIQFGFMVLCAPFFPFSALPDWLLAIVRFIPLAHSVDAFRSTLMGYPDGFPELASIEVELLVVTVFGLVMPIVGYYLYRWAENSARATGSLAEY